MGRIGKDEPRSHRRFRAQEHRHYRKLKYVFELKECAHFPRSLLGYSVQPIDSSVNDEDALIVSSNSIYGDIFNSEVAAPPFEEVNPLAIVLYEGPSDGTDDNVNGGRLSDVDYGGGGEGGFILCFIFYVILNVLFYGYYDGLVFIFKYL